MIRKIVKKILMIDRIRMARKRSFEEQVFENSPDNLKYSNINLDFRNRRIGKKYAKIGENSSVNATFTFETEEGFIEIGNHSFVGGGISSVGMES